MFNSLQWSYLVLLYTPCTNHHLNHSDSLDLGQRNKPPHRNRRFKQPQYTLGIQHNTQRRRICGAMGVFKYPVTHTQRETTEIIIASVYGPFSDGIGLPLHNIPSSGVLVKSIGAAFLRPDAQSSVSHMLGMQYQIVLNKTFWPKFN